MFFLLLRADFHWQAHGLREYYGRKLEAAQGAEAADCGLILQHSGAGPAADARGAYPPCQTPLKERCRSRASSQISACESYSLVPDEG